LFKVLRIIKGVNLRKSIFCASSDGHLDELKMLSPIINCDTSLIISDDARQTKFNNEYELVTLEKSDRKKKFSYLGIFYRNFKASRKLIRNHNIEVVVTTGSGFVLPILFAARIAKIKIVYIETFASVENISITGRISYRLTKYFFVQHEQLLLKYKNAQFKGGIY